jgi:photosystem II stability/assembly factor-like uncharacterized protein
MICLVVILSLAAPLVAQPENSSSRSAILHFTWKPQESGLSVSLRGLSVVSDAVAWVSGSNGRFAKTTDGGKTWQADSVKGAHDLDFRDVEAFDAQTAILMSAGSGGLSRIYKTTDGGRNWKLCYTNTFREGFFDGMAFWDERNGMAIGDPIDGRLFLMTTSDGGATWHRVPPDFIPAVLPKEYAFAASGTSIAVHGSGHVWIGTGGEAARVFRSTDRGKTWSVATAPVISGNESSGIFSLAFKDSLNGVAVGGDYKKPNETNANVAMTADGGKTWILVQDSQPAGYRSCVAFVANSLLPMFVAVGPSGSDFSPSWSSDGKMRWIKFSETGYHTVDFAKSSRAGWAAGADGRVAKLNNDFESSLSK